MTLILESLEDAITTIQSARRAVAWLSADNPVWLTLHHAEQYLAGEFKEEFNHHFNYEEEENAQ
jgi:hypothetical protein